LQLDILLDVDELLGDAYLVSLCEVDVAADVLLPLMAELASLVPEVLVFVGESPEAALLEVLLGELGEVGPVLGGDDLGVGVGVGGGEGGEEAAGRGRLGLEGAEAEVGLEDGDEFVGQRGEDAVGEAEGAVGVPGAGLGRGPPACGRSRPRTRCSPRPGPPRPRSRTAPSSSPRGTPLRLHLLERVPPLVVHEPPRFSSSDSFFRPSRFHVRKHRVA